MPLYICDVCSGIENTALGTSRYKENGEYAGFLIGSKDHDKINAWCSECTPIGKAVNGPGGVWHGQFPKEIADEAMVRECGVWPQPRSFVHDGFMHLGKFEYLRPELEKQLKAASVANKPK